MFLPDGVVQVAANFFKTPYYIWLRILRFCVHSQPSFFLSTVGFSILSFRFSPPVQSDPQTLSLPTVKKINYQGL